MSGNYSQKIKKIACIGAGYVGGPTMSVIADKCPHLEVTVVDINKEKIKAWNEKDLDKLPIYEPGLKEIIKRVRGRNLFFSSEISSVIENSQIIFISVNTPTKVKGFGAGYACDLKWVEASARQVGKYAKKHTIVVEKSTLPVKTAEVIKKILISSTEESSVSSNAKTFSVLSNPEFLAEGSAIKDLNHPDRILIGGDNQESINVLKSIYKEWVSEEKIISTNLWSSELSKLISNAFLAQRISSINAITALCEKTGAKVLEVSNAVGLDKRIGSKFLSPGPGFGGSCFNKDILNLVYISNYFGLYEVAEYWEQVIKINLWQKRRISKLIVDKLFGTVSLKKIVILGFAFKSNTNDVRESPAISIVKDLIENGAELIIHDPKVKPFQIENEINIKQNQTHENVGSWTFSDNIYQSMKNADAAVIITEWDEYKFLDWRKIGNLMRNPSWLFDCRSITKSKDLEDTGINYWSLGDGSLD